MMEKKIEGARFEDWVDTGSLQLGHFICLLPDGFRSGPMYRVDEIHTDQIRLFDVHKEETFTINRGDNVQFARITAG